MKLVILTGLAIAPPQETNKILRGNFELEPVGVCLSVATLTIEKFRETVR